MPAKKRGAVSPCGAEVARAEIAMPYPPGTTVLGRMLDDGTPEFQLKEHFTPFLIVRLRMGSPALYRNK